MLGDRDATIFFPQRTGGGGAAVLSAPRERSCVPAGSDDRQGTVNLSVPLSRMQTIGRGHGDLLATRAANFRPDLEGFGAGSSILCGSDMIAAEAEQVIDLIVG